MKKLLLIISISLTQAVFAEDAFISKVNYGGTGCKNDSAVAVLSPDQNILSLLFDDFLVEAGGESSNHVRKNCDVKLEISVPEDKRIVIKKIDYRGYAIVPAKAHVRFVSKYNFEIPTLNFISRDFGDRLIQRGDFDDDIFMELMINDSVTTRACGRDVILNIHTALMARSRADEVFASIDSLDSGIEYHLEYEDCIPNMRRTRAERQQRRIARQRAHELNRRNLHRRNEIRQRRMDS